jgi:type VI secretion system protein ImpL
MLIVVLAMSGTAFKIPATLIMIGVIVVLLVALALLARTLLKANKASTGIEASIRAQAERDLAAAPPGHRADIERLQERLETSIAQLKQSKLAGEGWFKSGKRALYALPWYVFIGPPGAGKTTALVHSGLRFPAGSDRLRGVGGTRNCDWFLSDQAILLDTAGRYTTEEQDRDEWMAFLDILKKHRPDRPINGVLVGISVPELLEAPRDEIEWHAENTRKRIDELIERLGVRFPVYVVFTKTDLIQGFVEFFGEMGRQERDQIWGCTFEPEEVDGDRVHDAFNREFERLNDSLVGRRNDRLRRAMKRDERHRVFTFPLEFASAREPLSRFLEGLFRPNPFHENPVFRGFYFTSGTQEGLPIERVIQAIADRFELPPQYAAAPEPQVETKSYFLTDVFTRVVIPDRNLVRPTGRQRTKARLATTGVGAAGVFLLALFVLGASQALVRSNMELNRLSESAIEAGAIDWRRASFSPEELTRMDAFRESVARSERGRPILQLGLDRRRSVREPAQNLYYAQARSFVEAHAVEQIRQSLRSGGQRAAGGFDYALGLTSADTLDAMAASDRERSIRRQRVYDDLKAYLLITDEIERLREERPLRDYVTAHLGGLAQQSVVGADTTGRGRLANLVARQTESYVAALVRGTAQPFAAEPSLVAQARNVIYEPPSVAGLYNRIKQDALFTLQPFTLADAVPGQYLALFEPAADVPGVFTIEGWNAVIAPAFERESSDPTRDDWVMGREGVELPPAMRDPAQIRAQLEERYLAEYSQAWERFLRSVRYRSFGDMQSAARNLGILGSASDSPVLWIMAVVTEQTSFGRPGGSEAVSEAASGLASNITSRLRARADMATGGMATAAGVGVRPGMARSDGTGLNSVERTFAGLHALKAPDAPVGGAAPELYSSLEALEQLGSILEGLAGEPAQAADFAAQVLQGNGGQLAQILSAVEAGTRRLDNNVRQALFVQPVRQAWGDILGTAQGHLNRRWRDEVYAPYQATLEGRYPLDPNSSNDAPLGDFEQFFAPAGGVLATFVEQALTPYLASDGRTARAWQGRGIGISPGTQRAIEQGRRIGEGLFAGRTMRVEFEMQADVPTREGDAPPPDQVYTRIHGTSDSYRMGSYRPWVTYAWPGTPGAMIGVSTRQGELPPKQFGGDWAVFRLLQDAEVRRASANQLAARWTFRQPGQFALTARYDLRVRSASGPFAEPGNFFRFVCPQTLG